jgi:hypothetical protein
MTSTSNSTRSTPQREAREAYIKSQAHEGWRLIPDRYDDGKGRKFVRIFGKPVRFLEAPASTTRSAPADDDDDYAAMDHTKGMVRDQADGSRGRARHQDARDSEVKFRIRPA